MLYTVFFNSFNEKVKDLKTRVRATTEKEAIEKAIKKICKQKEYENFYFDNEYFKIGDFYLKGYNFYNFVNGSRARYIRIEEGKK